MSKITIAADLLLTAAQMLERACHPHTPAGEVTRFIEYVKKSAQELKLPEPQIAKPEA